jgi:hypothetical protein
MRKHRGTRCAADLRRSADPSLWRRVIPVAWHAVSGNATEITARFDNLRVIDVVTKASRQDQIPIAKSTGGSVQ